MKYSNTAKYISILLAFYFGGSKASDEIFATDVRNTLWLRKPQQDPKCNNVIRQMNEKFQNEKSLYGFSLTFDDNKDSLFVGAPGCNGLYECKNFINCKDVSSLMYSSVNPGHRDWFGASLLSHGGKVIACAPRSLAEEIRYKNTFSSSILQYTGYRNMKENTGSCFVYENGRNSTASAFLLQNRFNVVPGYTQEELNDTIDMSINRTVNGNIQKFELKENPNILRHAVIMGNNIIAGKDDSFVVGLPYAWVGESYGSAFRNDNERRVGTIGRIKLDNRLGTRLTLPKNQEYRDVIGLSSQGGSTWASKKSRVSSEQNPVRNLYAGTSIAKGNLFPPTLNLNGCTSEDGFKFPERDLVDYAVGAPNVINEQGVVTGAVYLCPNCFRESGDTISLHSGFELTLNGFQFGERFGQTVLTIDINGDCYDDIVVGAPLHSTETKIEVGSIYVFKNRYHDNQDFEITATSENTNWKGNNGIYQLKREKASKGARFGMSLLRLGKFDGDNYEDFAVGAPYEDNGVGAVYIYRGSESFWRKDGVHDSQIKIVPQNAGLTQPIRGFGYSLSQNTKRIGNGRLAQFGVGAIPDKQLTSDSVAAVITSHPTIAILPDSFKSQIIATADNSNSPVANIEFVAKARTITNYDPSELKNLNLLITLEKPMDERILKSQQTEWKFSIPRRNNENDLYENQVSVQIRMKKERISQPAMMQFKLNWSTDIKDCRKDCKDPRNDWEEILDQKVWIDTGCEEVEQCKCNLKISNMDDNRDLVLGEDNELNVNFRLSNIGKEPAIGTDFTFSLPVDLEIMDLEGTQCKKQHIDHEGSGEMEPLDDEYVYECDIDKLDNDDTVEINIPLRLSNKKVLEGKLPYHENIGANKENYAIIQTRISTRDRCSIPSGQQRHGHTIDLKFRLFTKYSIKAVATKVEKAEQEMKNMSITHSYELKNMGPSITNSSSKFFVAVPKALKVKLTTEPNSAIICKRKSVRFPDSNFYNKLKSEDCSEVAQLEDSTTPMIAEFIRHDCEIIKGWQKSTPYFVVIDIDFNTNIIPKVKDEEGKEKLSDIFVLDTYLKTKDECVSAKTTFISEELGKTLAIKRMWPVFLGIAVSVLLFIAVVIICWRYELFDKLRFYNNKEDY